MNDMARKKRDRENARIIENCIGLSTEINKLAERCWLESRDIRLEAIAADAKEIQEALSKLNMRLFGQRDMFEDENG